MSRLLQWRQEQRAQNNHKTGISLSARVAFNESAKVERFIAEDEELASLPFANRFGLKFGEAARGIKGSCGVHRPNAIGPERGSR